MATTRTKFIPGLRLLFATLVLLFNSVAPAVNLMWLEPVTCGMACCLERGACYCNSVSHSRSGKESHGHSEGEESPDELDSPQPVEITAAAITSPCPAQCAQLPGGFQKHSRARAPAPRFAFVSDGSRRSFTHTPFLARSTLTADAHAPRAPPVILL
ncbi:MAG TPA: hypothetical protein VJ810_41480 [Blastocatellia bacterium]|nr:hypothetical protein [Blastocatellia bacterium]